MEALEEKIKTKRIKIPPASLISSASEETDVIPGEEGADDMNGKTDDSDSDLDLQEKLAAKLLVSHKLT